ncbi:MAG: copper homeostasis protein CutC [Chitinophagales bacterium]
MILEICAFNIQSCFIAEKGGAGRIELCADPLQGGTTPSYGLIAYALEHVSIPIYPMIRPRGGNFVYDADELALMKKDILACRELGCPGIATGVQLPGGKINTEQLKQITEWAYPMTVTCHKVFDASPDAFEALEAVIAAGCGRVLTSGLQKTALGGAALLSQLVVQAAGRIIIMPGGGVRSSDIAQLVRETGAKEFHSSALVAKGTNHIADEQEVRMMTDVLKGIGS